MNKRYGKKRVPDCVCLSNFTCQPCLKAVVYFYTPSNDEIKQPSNDEIKQPNNTKDP